MSELKISRARARRTAVFLACLAGAGSASTAPKPTPTAIPKVVQAIDDCHKVTDANTRLVCYDTAAAALDTAQTQGEVVVVDREQMRTVRRQAFGLTLPSLNLFPHATNEPMEAVTLILDHAGRMPDGNWRMASEESAVWMQTDGADIYDPPHKGSKLAVRRGALGSFFCKVDGQSAVRCRRET